MRKLLTYSVYLAVLAIVSTSHAQAACGGGGFHAPGTSVGVATSTSQKAPLAEVVYFEVYGATLDSTHFDSMSSRLDLSKGQLKAISSAKSEINGENEKLAKAQSKAQDKLNNCGGNCVDEKRNLARSTDALKHYNTGNEFELRLRSILRPSQAETYFRS